MAARTKLIPSKTWRPRVEDLKLIAELKAKTGMVNDSDVIRIGLRRFAESEGLTKKASA